ncbi:MAG TPA: RraA family protein [Candidatus Pseudogracilibacillus intestinigallinarum]|uniref:Putative 4-hydroxy-4-methyl-2-oxoglutarate aldolase n=1 Tax=Candidatus Pseudogracilibacillus intestinigallinarum TaxID=2838742 RepID=A0A9D1PL92_9BACI|nr:RraA family protein [Candidatus Pseudogracilibacillus intestinigallinarum]
MPSVVEQLKELPTTAISDVLKGLNNIDPNIKPLKDTYKIAGEAFTVQTAVGDNLALLTALKEAKQGDILVVDVKGDTYRAVAGDFVVAMMQTMELGGLVVDGAVRDVIDIKRLNFPVFVRNTTTASGSKNGPGATNIPISCGGMHVNPGDIIVGDVDGVVVIPKDRAEEVLTGAKQKVANDEEREAKILGNKEAVIEYVNGMIAKSKK